MPIQHHKMCNLRKHHHQTSLYMKNFIGCDKNKGDTCSKLFPLEHFIEMQAQYSFLTKDELDVMLLGFISSAMMLSKMAVINIPPNVDESQWPTNTMVQKCAEKPSFFCMALGRTAFRVLRITTRLKIYKYT